MGSSCTKTCSSSPQTREGETVAFGKRLQLNIIKVLGKSRNSSDAVDRASHEKFLPSGESPQKVAVVHNSLQEPANIPMMDTTGAFVRVEAAYQAIDEIAKIKPFQSACLRNQVLNIKKDTTQLEGAIAFVDVSGFSALTHALGKDAKGAMLLSQYINDYLTCLIEVVQEFHGDVITFAGDAFIALWKYVNNTAEAGKENSPKIPLWNAITCSLKLQEKYNKYQVPGTNVLLKIHVGISYGSFFGLIFTTPRRRLFTLTGRPMGNVGDAVDAAESGQVCLTSTALPLIAPLVTGKMLEDGCYLVDSIAKLSSSYATYSQPDPSIWTVDIHEVLEQFLPSVLLDQLRGLTLGSRSITTVIPVTGDQDKPKTSISMALQRFVSVLFLAQPSIEYSDPSSVRLFADEALQIVLRNNGEILQVIQDDKGLHMIAVFGLQQSMSTPAIPAIQSAQDLLNSEDVNVNVSCRIGVTTGNAFCGIVGSTDRRAFDVLGDTVNLSCRMMQLAQDIKHNFLCDQASCNNCAGRFLFNKLPVLYKMKGQSKGLAVYTLQVSSEAEVMGLNMLHMLRKRLQVHSSGIYGRNKERAVLNNSIRHLLALHERKVRKGTIKPASPTRSPSNHLDDVMSITSGGAPEAPRKAYFQIKAGRNEVVRENTTDEESALTNASGNYHPMIIVEGPLGIGKSILVVDLQNQWPLLPIIVADVSAHDHRPLAVFRVIISSLFAWIRMYPGSCGITATTDEDIVRQLLPSMEDKKLSVLDSILFTHFQAIIPTTYEDVSGGIRTSGEEKSPIQNDSVIGSPTVPMVLSSVSSIQTSIISGKQSNVSSEFDSESIRRLIKLMIQSLCSRVKALILCYDDAQYLGVASQALIEELHFWAMENSYPFLQIVLVETGYLAAIPAGALRYELRELSLQDVRECLRITFSERVLENDVIPDTLCHVIAKKANFHPTMLAELTRFMSQPAVLQGVYTDKRGRVRIKPEILVRMLDFEFSASRSISQLVAHIFDGLDPPQQTVAKAASVILLHPEARLYRPMLYLLVNEFSNEVVDEQVDWLVAKGILMIDTAGRAIAEEWQTVPRYKFALESFGVVLTSLMAPDMIMAMNVKLSVMLQDMVDLTALNMDIMGLRLFHGQKFSEAAQRLMDAMELYLDEDENAGNVIEDETLYYSLYRAQKLRELMETILQKNTHLPEMKDLKARFTQLSSRVLASATKRFGNSETDLTALDQPTMATSRQLLSTPSTQLARKKSVGADATSSRKASVVSVNKEGKNALVGEDSSGVVDLDTTARRCLILLRRVEDGCVTKRQLYRPVWLQFIHVLQILQRIENAVREQAIVGRDSNATTSKPDVGLQLDEINQLIQIIEGSNYPENYNSIPKLRNLLSNSITVATAAARKVIMKPVSEVSFGWKDVYMVHITTIDYQHRILFNILERLAKIALRNEAAAEENLYSEMDKVLKGLLEYVLFHFLAEESIMRKIRYPQYIQHRRVHQIFTQRCLNIQSQFHEHSLELDGPLVSSMYQWLVVHIGNSDQHYSAHYFKNCSGTNVDIEEDLVLAGMVGTSPEPTTDQVTLLQDA